ncbi:sulfate ABC transporter substrate-binding protein [Paraburkholderia sp. XV]|uniref:sulfate ABC transporter substrate-binding protein n=1 Tax=Paraburkholderia sp. XV TaxID=2831520 RepID=UPI001CD4A919|nr:sulfate ABC transporter substrate-binding protein [Paraburkholderia sp. XV]
MKLAALLSSAASVSRGALLLGGLLASLHAAATDTTLLNVSYDPTRELYTAYDKLFSAWYRQTGGETLTVRTTNGGSGAQARQVLAGQQADVVTLGIASDIDALAARGLLRKDWQRQLPYNSTPYTSTIVFLVRAGNPKGIHDWNDLVKPGVGVVTPNPKTSSGARWNYLAAWAYAMRQPEGNEVSAKAFEKKLYRNVKVLDSGARGATNSFVERGIGDVLVAWEDDALLAVNKLAPGKYQVVVPSISIRCEPPVAVIDSVVDQRGTRKIAQAYLEHMYSPEAQALIAENYYRPAEPSIAAKYARLFPAVKLVGIDDPMFGGWHVAQAKHFADGGVFDQIFQPN